MCISHHAYICVSNNYSFDLFIHLYFLVITLIYHNISVANSVKIGLLHNILLIDTNYLSLAQGTSTKKHHEKYLCMIELTTLLLD